jgi:hypothetical protein
LLPAQIRQGREVFGGFRFAGLARNSKALEALSRFDSSQPGRTARLIGSLNAKAWISFVASEKV